MILVSASSNITHMWIFAGVPRAGGIKRPYTHILSKFYPTGFTQWEENKQSLSTTPLSFDAHSRRTPANIRIYLISLETRSAYILPLIVWDYFSNFLSALHKISFCKSEVSAVQGHPRSMILVPIERAYATSY